MRKNGILKGIGWSKLALGLAIASLISCSTQSENSPRPGANLPSKPNVVASYNVLCHFTEAIAETTVNLTCLIPPGQDPHAYSSTPSDRRALEAAQLIFYGGYNFAPGVEGLITQVKTDASKVAVHEQAVPEPILSEHHHDREEHSHAEAGDQDHEATDVDKQPDTHIWHDVKNAIAMTAVIEAELARLNPDAADAYAENGRQLRENLEKLDNWVKEQVATLPPSQRVLVTTHDAFNYYLQAYGFKKSEALLGTGAEEAPTASEVKELVETVKAAQVKTIFTEASASDRVIKTVAREAGVKLSEQPLIADGLGPEGSDSETYVGTIAANTCAIVVGLGGRCEPFAP